MIRAMMTASGHCGRIFLAPNRSMSPQANVTFLCGVLLFSLLLGIGLTLAGAWLVLPFLLIEMLLLGWVIYWLLHRLQCAQMLVIGPNKVVVVHWGCRVVLNRGQVRLLIEAPERFTDWPKLMLAGEGHSIPLGAFLNERESSVLRTLLRETGLRSVQEVLCQQEF